MKVKIQYWGSKCFGHGTHQDLLENFKKAIQVLDYSKLIQISMDGPLVSLKFYDCTVRVRESNELYSLVITGNCNLHVVSGAL